MARSLRHHRPGFLYHLFSRGNNKEKIFFNNSDKEKFIGNLKRFKKQFKYKLYAYVLMSNHFHLLLQVKKESISKIMQVIMTSYTMYINKKHDRTGHLFSGRFKSIIVDEDEYLLQVIRYIHLNPVKSGLCQNPDQYIWSSFSDYLSFNTSLIDNKKILFLFGNSIKKQKEKFLDFTQRGIDKNWDIFQKQKRGVLGKEKFVRYLSRSLGKRV